MWLFDNKIPLHVATDVSWDMMFKSKKWQYVLRFRWRPKWILEEMYNMEFETRGDVEIAKAESTKKYKELLDLLKRLEWKEAPFVLYSYNNNHGQKTS